MATLVVDPAFGWVVLVCVASVFLLFYLGFKVGRARKTFDVKYPAMYSEKSIEFNCIQRAHQNTLEGYPVFIMLLIFGGIQHPCVSALAGVVYLAGRVVYAQGYSTGDPAKRTRGAFGYLGFFTLLACTISYAVHTLRWV